MKELNRRSWLKLAGAGSVVAAGALVPAARARSPRAPTEGAVAFRAVGALPAHPLPAFATYVIEGHVDPATRTGTLTKAVLTGAPGAVHAIALPGTARLVRVTDVRDVAGILHIRGVVDDRSQLQKGESATVEVQLDRARGVASTDFLSASATLRLES